MVGDVRADDLRPAAEDGRLGQVRPGAGAGHPVAERGAERLRVPGVGARARPPTPLEVVRGTPAMQRGPAGRLPPRRVALPGGHERVASQVGALARREIRVSPAIGRAPTGSTRHRWFRWVGRLLIHAAHSHPRAWLAVQLVHTAPQLSDGHHPHHPFAVAVDGAQTDVSKGGVMAIVLGFVPWIVYWVLVGNAPFKLAVGVAFAITVLIELLHRLRKERAHTLEIGNLAVFALLTVAAFTVPTDVLERWLQPVSSAGLFLIALVGVLAGHPFVREYAEDTVDEATARSEGFKSVTAAMTWMWVGAFGIMLASTLIPPVVDGDATIRDMENPLSILCYWVIPFTVLGVAGAISAVFPPWFEKRSAAVDQRSAAHHTVVAQAPPPADVATDLVRIDAPPDSRMDEAFGVRVDLSAAGKPHPTSATVTTSGHDLYGHLWRSRAELAVPPSGVVDLAVAVPSPEPSAAPTGVSDWTTADADAEAGISQVPLERFAGALQLLAIRTEVDPTRVAAMAISRGSEGLLAALGHGLAPAPRAVILVSPSSVR